MVQELSNVAHTRSPERETKLSNFIMLNPEKYESLEAENKALRERHLTECCTDWKQARLDEIEVLKESRDELLEALKLSVETEIDEGYVFNDSIQRAEALKEKPNE